MEYFIKRVATILICVALVFVVLESQVFATGVTEAEETAVFTKSAEPLDTSEEEAGTPGSGKVTKGFSRSWILVVVIGAAIVASINTRSEKSP